MVKSIYADYIGKPMANVFPTQLEQKYVIPRWTPFKTIEWLALRAIPAKRSDETNYVFYETVDGHNFLPLSELCAKESVMKYYQLPTGIRGNSSTLGDSKNLVRDFSNLLVPVRFMKTTQKMSEFVGGAFSSVLYQHDVTTKQWGKTVFNYNDDFQKTRSVGKEKTTTNQSRYTKNPNVHLNLVTKQTGLMGADYPKTQNHEEWLQKTISSKALIDTIRTRIKVPGNSGLRVGDVVELYLPKISPLKTSDTEWYDEQTSGKYLIMTLRHTISGDEYTNTIMLAKNSYEKAIPDKSEFMGVSDSTQSNILENK